MVVLRDEIEGVEAACGIMEAFAEWTGLGDSPLPARRYLWTDAFAVCSYLGLHARTGQERYRALALDLVDQVHRILGRHRDDDERDGWISELTEEEGARRPTAGGLRIGKPQPERAASEPYDARGEWDRDGQYYHYLTKWIHALDRVWRVTGDVEAHRQAVDLALWAHDAFSIRVEGRARLCWKVSIDGSRPLVPSSGMHDPLDGLITVRMLIDGAPVAERRSVTARLGSVVADLEGMCHGRSWTTEDPLGAGSLLIDVLRVRSLSWSREAMSAVEHGLVSDATASLELAAVTGPWERPPERRAAFRELGLSLGIRAAAKALEGIDTSWRPGMTSREGQPAYARLADVLGHHGKVAARVRRFWLEPEHRAVTAWDDRREICSVMLASALVPEGFLGR